MKITSRVYRISKNGSILTSIEKEALTSEMYLGNTYKQNGIYYYLNRRQGNLYVYLP